ncbi:MAG: hypothetical protein WEB85_14185 [Dongiaceae bacterium]
MPSEPTDPRSPRVPIEAKVEFLKRPEAYPERPRRVETVETHMSWVFLTDRYAYKLKKPVRYDYLDYGTVEARRRNSEEEIRLNRRLAPEVYLDLVPLVGDAADGLRLGGAGVPVDWLVKMRRLPEAVRLDRAIETGTLDEAELRRATILLAEFYRRAPPVEVAPADYRRGFAAGIEGSHRDLLRPEFGLPAAPLERATAAQLRFLEGRSEVLDRRVRERRIVEAHGDLRPEHIYLGPQPVIVDCLEFNRAFRILDPADELAYLAMECDRLNAPAVGQLFLDTYGRVTGDEPPAPLLRFYKCFRACLRAKIAIWHLDEPAPRDRAQWTNRAAAYLRLAEGYAEALP